MFFSLNHNNQIFQKVSCNNNSYNHSIFNQFGRCLEIILYWDSQTKIIPKINLVLAKILCSMMVLFNLINNEPKISIIKPHDSLNN